MGLSSEAMSMALAIARSADLDKGIASHYSATEFRALTGVADARALSDGVRELERAGLVSVLRAGHGPCEVDFVGLEPTTSLFYEFASDVHGEWNPENDPIAAAQLISELGEATELDFQQRLGWNSGRANLAVAFLAERGIVSDVPGTAPFGFYKALARPHTRLFAKGLS
jgi:hypothetical protein